MSLPQKHKCCEDRDLSALRRIRKSWLVAKSTDFGARWCVFESKLCSLLAV